MSDEELMREKLVLLREERRRIVEQINELKGRLIAIRHELDGLLAKLGQ